jgi:16S rRNA (cytidine1402-2'-O)-methyltransferase
LAAALYLVATPIGNLEDITLRALRVLRDEVQAIACEDTRQTQKLLDRYQIHKPLLSYHEHNESSRAIEITERLARGESVAIVTDAGTPLISDPGFRAVSAAIEAGFPVIPLPGPSAALTALAGSGLPVDEFRFVGFIPSKSQARKRLFEALRTESATVIAYESPHRILECLADLEVSLPGRPIALARELTKIHEEFLRGTPAEVHSQLAARAAVKGEFTLVIGRSTGPSLSGDPRAAVQQLEAEGVERMEAIKTIAKQMGLPKREVYRLLTAPDNNPSGKRRD